MSVLLHYILSVAFLAIRIEATECSGLKEAATAVELYHLQDLSGKVKRVVANVATQFKLVLNEINQSFDGPNKIGVGTFTDKPSPGGIHGMHCFWNRIPLGNHSTDIVVDALSNSTIVNDFDKPDAVLDAILYALKGPEAIWADEIVSTGVLRILSIYSDNEYHVMGDSLLPANDGTATKGCEFEDYPSEEQVDHGLRQYSVILVFLVPTNQLAHYSSLAVRISAPAVVVEVQADSTDFSEAIMKGIKRCSHLVPGPISSNPVKKSDADRSTEPIGASDSVTPTKILGHSESVSPTKIPGNSDIVTPTKKLGNSDNATSTERLVTVTPTKILGNSDNATLTEMLETVTLIDETITSTNGVPNDGIQQVLPKNPHHAHLAEDADNKLTSKTEQTSYLLRVKLVVFVSIFVSLISCIVAGVWFFKVPLAYWLRVSSKSEKCPDEENWFDTRRAQTQREATNTIQHSEQVLRVCFSAR